MKKRLMALLLVLCMVLGMFPTTASAADAIPAADLLTMTGYELGASIGAMGGSWLTGNGALNWTITVSDSDATAPSVKVFEADTQYYLWIQSRSTDVQLSVNGETLTPCNSSAGALSRTNYWFKLPMLEADAPAPATYGITVSESENGTVTADKATAAEGETVTLTVTPANGYKLDTLTVNGKAIEGTTFTMPAEAVEISATFVEDPYPNRVNIQLSGYEIGKVAKYASVKMYDTNGTDVTASEWYCCVVDSNEGCNWNIGELKANTRYWLRIERYISGYKASDFGLMDMEAVSVTDSSGGGNFLIYIELPMLEAPAPATYDITVNAAENGTVTADKATAAEGETVTLTVAPAEGYVLDTLTVGELELTKVNDTTYTFVMPASAVTVNASFKLKPVTYAVTVSEMLGGTVTADKAEAAAGDTVTLTVKAAVYYELDTLAVTDAAGNEVTVTDNAFTMPDGAVTVSATFKQTSGMEQYFTVTVDGVEYPAQYIGVQYYDDAKRDCEAFLVKLPEGTTSMAVDSDYKLYVLDMTNTTIASGNDPINLPVNGAVTTYKVNSYVGTNYPHYCYLRVELPSYDITLNTPENGKLKADKTVAVKGETVTLTVTPNKGYELDTLTVPGAEVTKVDDVTYTFAMPNADTQVTAVFKEIPPEYYGIILNDTVNGTVTADKTEAVMGDTVKLTITPAAGYAVDKVTVLNASGAKVAVAEDYSFTMPGSAVDVTVTFKVAAKVYVNVNGYELGQKGNQVKATFTLADGGTFTPDYWYIHTATDMNSYYKGELQADTTYWLCIQTGSTKYKASDFALEGLDAVSVVDKSDSYQLFFFIELPQLKEPEPMYPINTTIYNGTVKAFVDGKEVTEASAGQTVTLEVTPDKGYTLTDFYVLNEYAQIVPSVQTGANTYTFVMPQKESWMKTHGIYLEAWFSEYIVDDQATIILGDKRGAYPGDLLYIPVTATAPPSGDYYIFDLDVRLPDGWVIESATEGRDSRLTSTDSWMATPTTAGRWGLIAQYAGSAGIGFPEGEVMILKIRVPADAAPGTYKLDAVAASLSMDQVESVASNFGQYVDGYVSVKAKPADPIKLDAPVLTADQVRTYETMIDCINQPDCTQDAAATLEFSYSADNENWSDWAEAPQIRYMETITDGDVRYIAKELQPDTTYYVRARYAADNTVCYADSDPVVLEVKTKALDTDPMTVTLGDVATAAGETFTVPVVVEHGFDDLKFHDFGLHTGSDSNFTLVGVSKGADNTCGVLVDGKELYVCNGMGGKVIPEGELVLLTFKVNDGVAPGNYELNPFAQDSNGSYTIARYYQRIFERYGGACPDYLIDYPIALTIEPATITVKGRMDAPVLTDATAYTDSITVTAPHTVSGVAVEYAISTDGKTWSAWQQSNNFEDLTVNTEYQIRARYVPEATSVYAASDPSNIITATTSYDDITFTVADAASRVGKTVTVSVSVDSLLEKQTTALNITPVYDTGKLTLDSATLGEAMTGEGWKLLAGDEIQIYQSGDAAFTVPDGEVVKLTFTVAENAAAGDLEISLTADLYNGDVLMNVDAVYTAGTLHIHDESIVEGYAATCYADGMTNGLACSLCDEVFTEQYVIESKGHVLSDEVVAPTHDCKGYTVTSCANCDYSKIGDFTDALDHDYVQSVSKEATCVEEGEWTFTCDCGDSYTLTMPTTDHDCDATVTEPTCTEGGYTTHTCKHCEFSYFTDLTEATGHKPVVIDAKEPTEDEEGYTGDTVCEVCEEVLEKGEVIPALKHTCPAEEYSDVDTGKWYHDAIDYVLDNGLMNGVGNGKFAPDAVTTRGQMVTILYRAAGSPSVAGLDNPFTDVASGSYYTKAVIWAYHNGVVNGTSATTFSPDATITRQDLVTILYRYTGSPAADGSALNGYADAGSVSGYAKNAMAWAVGSGVVNGTSSNTLSPKNNANRAQIAQILMNYLG